MKDTVYHICSNKALSNFFLYKEPTKYCHAQFYLDDNGDLIIINLNTKIIINGLELLNPTKVQLNDKIKINESIFILEDLYQSMAIFDTQKDDKTTTPLISSNANKNISNKDSNKTKSEKKKKIMLYALLVLGLIIIGYGISVIVNQNQKHSKYVSDNNTEQDENSSNNNKENKTSNSDKHSEEYKKQRTDVTYDFSCLYNDQDAGSNEMIYDFGEFTRNTQNALLEDVSVTIEEEKEYGDKMIEQYKKEYTFKDYGVEFNRLNKIMNDLVRRLAKPRGVKYEMHYVDDDVQNVFTSGGHIVFFKGMYKMCKTDSELASIISHEISHNELCHLTLYFKKLKSANQWGVLGEIALAVEDELTISFNQKQETEADLFGMDIMYPSQYKNCDALNLWNRLSEDENEFNVLDNFFRSHPYSTNRASCIERHLESNYDKSCK